VRVATLVPSDALGSRSAKPEDNRKVDVHARGAIDGLGPHPARSFGYSISGRASQGQIKPYFRRQLNCKKKTLVKVHGPAKHPEEVQLR